MDIYHLIMPLLILLIIVLTFSNQLTAYFNPPKNEPQNWIIPTYSDKMDIQVISQDPKIILYHNFLSDYEIQTLKNMATPLLKRSTVMADNDKSTAVHPDRTSETCFLPQAPIIDKIKARANKYSRMPIDNIEPLQIVRYREGQEYKPHYDYFTNPEKGQRFETFLVYLNDSVDFTGGDTVFPNLNLRIRPKKGTALFWENCHATTTGSEGDPKTLHAGAPIGDGEKWAMNIWIRDCTYIP